MATKVLTAAAVERLKADPAKRREIPDAALPGLYLIAQPTGAKSYALRYRHGGRKLKLTLGRHPVMSLAEAREKARGALRVLSAGGDPAARDTGAGEVRLIRDVVAEFVARYAKPRNRTWAETERLLAKGDLVGWQARDVRLITRRDVLKVLDTITDRGAAIQANRVHATLRKFFAWAVTRGEIDASPMTGLGSPSQERSRDRVLSDAELRAIWKGAEALGFPFGAAVQLLILTGQRRSEVLEAPWSEFDLAAKTWTIPRERSKNGVAHIVPLSDTVIALVESLPEQADRPGVDSLLLFTGRTGETPFSGVSKATAQLTALAVQHTKDKQPLAPWRLHDIRRTFASGCGRLGVPVHVTEKALNHVSGTHAGIVGVYQRHEYLDERRHALDAWAAHVIRLVSDKATPDNVVSLAVARV